MFRNRIRLQGADAACCLAVRIERISRLGVPTGYGADAAGYVSSDLTAEERSRLVA